MRRVIAILATLPLLSACSLSAPDVSMGFSDLPNKPATERSTSTFSGGFNAKPQASRSSSNRNTRVAALDDRSASGSYEKAKPGSLADRDYGSAQLDSDRALDMINEYRKASGLKPLKLDAALTTAAKAHARDLAKWDRISHYGSDGSNPWDRVKRTGFKAKLAAKNVGTGQATLDEVFVGWKKGPGHNKNLLLADATHMGIALVSDPKTEFKTFWTLVLGTPL